MARRTSPPVLWDWTVVGAESQTAPQRAVGAAFAGGHAGGPSLPETGPLLSGLRWWAARRRDGPKVGAGEERGQVCWRDAARCSRWGRAGALLTVMLLALAGQGRGQSLQVNSIPPQADGTCQKGYQPCFLSESYGGYQQLGSDPVPPDEWNLTFSFWGREYIEAAQATGCEFSGNDKIVFANTQYENILVFQRPRANASWTRDAGATHDVPCAPRGLALLPGDSGTTADATQVLFACTAGAHAGKIFNMSLIDGTLAVVSAGIDFSPNNPQFPRTAPQYMAEEEINEVPELASTIMQSATNSANMLIGIKVLGGGDTALVTNKNHNHMIVIDLSRARDDRDCEEQDKTLRRQICRDYGWDWEDQESTTGPMICDGCSSERNRSLYACCRDPEMAAGPCCTWRVEKLNRDFLFPTGIDISPDGSYLASGTAYPSGKVLFTPLSSPTGSEPLIDDPTHELNSSAGLDLHAYSPTFFDGSGSKGVYVASLGAGKIWRLANTGGSPVAERGFQTAAVMIKEIDAPRTLCLSPDARLLGVAGASEVGVLGKPGCDLLGYCAPCLVAPAHNASFYRECEWRCQGGWYFQETTGGDPDLDVRAQILPSTGRGGFCMPCAAGKYSEFDAGTKFLNVSDCIPCPFNTSSASPMLGSSAGCLACSPGKYSHNASGATACEDLP